jgi:sec-independent protein translocase protein TatA
MFGLEPLHLVLILAIALIVLGPGKLPQAGKALGEAIRGFREGAAGKDEPKPPDGPPSPPTDTTAVPPSA